MVLDYSDVTLWISPDKFYLECEDKPGQLLIIDRITCGIALERNRYQIPMTACSRRSICGLLGILSLMSGPHLVVVVAKSKIGHITPDNHAVWRLDEAALIPFAVSDFHLSPHEKQVSQEQSVLVDGLLNGQALGKSFFFFCHTFDLTQCRQKLDLAPGHPGHVLAGISASFTWNYNLLKEHFLPRSELHSWCVALLEGACFIHQCSISGKLFRWSLISRRSSKMAGTRFNRRGADSGGFVANFVETEQILEHDDTLISFVQVRGSIPFFWRQTANLAYLPSPVLSAQMHQQSEPMTRHFDRQLASYWGYVLALNLVNHRKEEGQLERLYQHLLNEFRQQPKQMTSGGHVEYEAFDFHSHCPNLKDWRNLDQLIRKLKVPMGRMGFYVAKCRSGTVHHLQAGVIRTNCMDCLDRTNVVQSLIAFENLAQGLRMLKVLKPDEDLSCHRDFSRLFRHVWSDHADALALHYAGSRALKTDFTRTGQRSWGGVLTDLKIALIRYLSNNFFDGRRQDGISLFLGHVSPQQFPSDLLHGKPPRLRTLLAYLPLLLLCSLSLLFLASLSIVLTAETASWMPVKQAMLILLFLSSTSCLILLTVVRHSYIYVDRPRYAQS